MPRAAPVPPVQLCQMGGDVKFSEFTGDHVATGKT